MKEINMYIRGSAYNTKNGLEGQYIVIMEYKSISKEFYGLERDMSVTSARMLIKALMDGLRLLKESCKINLYTHGYVGLGKLKSNKGNEIKGVRSSVNKDLLLILKEEIIKGEHEINEIVGKTRQDELIRKLKKQRS